MYRNSEKRCGDKRALTAPAASSPEVSTSDEDMDIDGADAMEAGERSADAMEVDLAIGAGPEPIVVDLEKNAGVDSSAASHSG